MEPAELLEITAEIVSAYVGHNQARASELPDLVATVHSALMGIAAPKPVEAPKPELTPAVPIKKSIADDYLICLDDGKKFRSLKRHLSQLGMTPDEYRTKWGLPRDYPMVAPGYAAKRSELAKLIGLGNRRRRGAEPVDAAEAPGASEEPVETQDEVIEAAAPGEAESAAEVQPEAEAAEEPEAAPKRRGRPKKAA